MKNMNVDMELLNEQLHTLIKAADPIDQNEKDLLTGLEEFLSMMFWNLDRGIPMKIYPDDVPAWYVKVEWAEATGDKVAFIEIFSHDEDDARIKAIDFAYEGVFAELYGVGAHRSGFEAYVIAGPFYPNKKEA